MSNIEQARSIDELKKFSMQELSSLYSKIVKAHCPKFSDKTVAAKRILPLLEQKRAESKLTFVDPPKDLSKLIKVRGRPKGQLLSLIHI